MKKKIAIALILAILCTAYAVLARVKTWGLAIYTLNTAVGKILVKSWRPAALLAVILWIIAVTIIKKAVKKRKAAKLAEKQSEEATISAGQSEEAIVSTGQSEEAAVAIGQAGEATASTEQAEKEDAVQ